MAIPVDREIDGTKLGLQAASLALHAPGYVSRASVTATWPVLHPEIVIGLDGGYGVVVIDRFPISGEFTTAVRIQGRRSGSVTFRRGSKLHVRDAFDDAVVIEERKHGPHANNSAAVEAVSKGLPHFVTEHPACTENQHLHRE